MDDNLLRQLVEVHEHLSNANTHLGDLVTEVPAGERDQWTLVYDKYAAAIRSLDKAMGGCPHTINTPGFDLRLTDLMDSGPEDFVDAPRPE